MMRQGHRRIQLISSVEIATRAAGDYHAYKYYNYADKSKDVISSYGSASVAELQAIRKYNVYGLC